MSWIIKNLIVLFFCQMAGMSSGALVILIGGIIGKELAPTASLSTLPIALLIVGAAIASLPAAWLMNHIGRKVGFFTGILIAFFGTGTAIIAILQKGFLLFCGAMLCVGINLAFVQQYRFAATENVEPEKVGKAISFLLIAGIVAAFLGPYAAKEGIEWFETKYIGSFVGLGILLFVSSIFILFYQDPDKIISKSKKKVEPPIRVSFLKEPKFYLAVASAAIAYGVMSLIMTATPVQMKEMSGFSMDHTSIVIQSHILGMYLPSLVGGILIRKLGIKNLIYMGICVMFICVGIGFYDQTLLHYFAALILLGIGWNFLFLSGTTLLTQTYKEEDRFKAQAINDFIVYGFSSIASLLAGMLLFSYGWHAVLAVALPALVILMATNYLIFNKPRIA